MWGPGAYSRMAASARLKTIPRGLGVDLNNRQRAIWRFFNSYQNPPNAALSCGASWPPAGLDCMIPTIIATIGGPAMPCNSRKHLTTDAISAAHHLEMHLKPAASNDL